MFKVFEKNKDIGLFLFRLFIGVRILYGVIDNIIDPAKMQEFENFLKAHLFPIPYISAVISVYAQAVAGLLYILGYKIRWAALLMVFNFIIAVTMIHWEQRFEEMTPALSMLFASVLFLFTGAGKFGLDKESLSPNK